MKSEKPQVPPQMSHAQYLQALNAFRHISNAITALEAAGQTSSAGKLRLERDDLDGAIRAYQIAQKEVSEIAQ